MHRIRPVAPGLLPCSINRALSTAGHQSLGYKGEPSTRIQAKKLDRLSEPEFALHQSAGIYGYLLTKMQVPIQRDGHGTGGASLGRDAAWNFGQAGNRTIPGLENVLNPGAEPFQTFQQSPMVLRSGPVAGRPNALPSQPQGQLVVKTSRTKGEPITKPSKASGGVPTPTADYLLRSSRPPSTLSQPRQILVVMDLNGTLLFRPNRKNPRGFVERPYAKRFLQYCIDTFKVVIWSSARPENVANMCNVLLDSSQDNSYRKRVVSIWGRDKFGLSAADYMLRVQCYKRLSRVWSDPKIARSHPDFANGGRWDQTNTVLVDDSLEKARSEPHNLLQIPEFFGDLAEARYIVPQVHNYLNALCYQADVSTYMRTNPFRLEADFTLASD